MGEKLKFKISSALKDIIGRDLITDDLIAVFELVKNSYDAYATRVDIIFEKNNNGNNRIIIKDNGKGMDFNDLKNKWLFVAYSAKKDGSEDENFDYRDKINANKAFAGAKGIGRFSCDRLGKTLLLETTKKEKNPKTEVLYTNWEKFENNLKAEFVDVNVDHETIEKSNFGLKNGTVLVIENLRSEWERSKLLKLKDSLAKLINPNIDSRSGEFSIYIEAKEELELDEKEQSYRQKVNGEVKNFIFETLELKTTKITTSITEDGKFVTTEIIDGGTLIYKIKEENKFSLLNGIDITLFYLNRSAKVTFTKRMGISSRNYGHIFLYKNGFRVYPFGEPGEDPLKIDVRKAQGYNRFLGTRDLIGQIEINHDSDELKETSSRGDGLIKTNTYYELEEFFWESLKRLEKYVVEVQQWGLSIENLDESANIESRITDLIAKISGTTELVDIEYSPNFLEILSKSQEGSVESIINNLNKVALKSKNEKLIIESKKASKVLDSIKKALVSAEEDAELQRKVVREKDKELTEKDSENLFLKSVKSQDFDEVVSFLHHIGISSKNIDNELKLFVKKLKKGKEIKTEDLISKLESILFENRKIISISKFASKANFKLYTANKELDIVNYISEYVKNILGLVSTQDPKVIVKSEKNISFIKDVKPIELNIIIDNLISNSRRAKANKIEIIISKPSSDFLEIKFIDNGKGIEKENQKKIFEMGYTTTSGSGIGLFHIKKILNEMGSSIELNNKNKSLTEFVIKLYK